MQTEKIATPKVSASKLTTMASFAYVSFLVLIFVLVSANIVKLALDSHLSFYVQPGSVTTGDFVKLYQCGKTVLLGLGQKAFTSQTQISVLNSIIAPAHTDIGFWIQHVPFVYLAMVPFAILPVHIAHLVWSYVSLAAAAYALFIILRKYRAFDNKSTALFLIGMAASIPTMEALYFGQMSLWLLAFVCLYCLSFLTRRDIVGGITLALTTIKPQFSILLALPALAEKRWKLLIAALLAEFGLLSLAAQAIGWNNVLNYPQYVLEVEAHAQSNALYMVCFRGLFSRILPQETVMPVCLWLLLISAVMIFYFWQPTWARLSRNVSWGLALVVLLDLLAAPGASVYDCPLVACCAALTLPTMRLSISKSIQSASLRLWTTIFLLYPLISYILFLLGKISAGLPPIGFAVVNLVLFIAGVRYLMGETPQIDDESTGN